MDIQNFKFVLHLYMTKNFNSYPLKISSYNLRDQCSYRLKLVMLNIWLHPLFLLAKGLCE